MRKELLSVVNRNRLLLSDIDRQKAGLKIDVRLLRKEESPNPSAHALPARVLHITQQASPF